ncbi:hypothetical protein [Heliorestis convoluta]|uniref:Uncharacterized protein n=1 Tax=Heliorestis convoluta TaxID=356322 RepID=A0A5Q2MVS7_9FIRM|nr:hypothetical protein [Heliorestis convoluta]QGG46364.1 hypothetical protein FTV88_0185 [Heliorestis convoluta]
MKPSIVVAPPEETQVNKIFMEKTYELLARWAMEDLKQQAENHAKVLEKKAG